MTKSNAQHAPDRVAWRWYLAWAASGAVLSFGFLSFLLVGLAGSFVAMVTILLLALGSRSRRGAPGLLAGVGLPLLYVAFLNRDGPGNVCSSSSLAVQCTQETSPLPWLLMAGVLLLAGAAWCWWARRA
jgi:hypothetical protein